MNITTPKIVVIGGGAGGLELATQLGQPYPHMEAVTARSSDRLY